MPRRGAQGKRKPLEERLLAKTDRLYGDVPEHRPELGPCYGFGRRPPKTRRIG